MVIKFKPLAWKAARATGGVDDYWCGILNNAVQATVELRGGFHWHAGHGYNSLEEAQAAAFEAHKQRTLALLDLPEGDVNL